MDAIYFFLGCLAFFGIPAYLVCSYTSYTQDQLDSKIKKEFLAQFE